MNCLWHLHLHSLVSGFLSRLTPDSIKTLVHDEEEEDGDEDDDEDDFDAEMQNAIQVAQMQSCAQQN